jgi:glycosyltransferase involved in cell wall biosynthesis
MSASSRLLLAKEEARRDSGGRIFVSWAPFCSRSDTLARELGGASHMVYHRFWGSNYATIALKYASQTLATLLLLIRSRPRCIFVMSPPPVAALVVAVYAWMRRVPYVIDAHSASFVDRRWRGAMEGLQRFVARRALTTLVTNEEWRGIVNRWGGRSDIVTDVPVRFPPPAPLELGPGFHVTVVSTFTWDEPTEIVFAAAHLLPEVSFHVTGDFRRLKPAVMRKKPPNVRLTGFLPVADYAALLTNSHGVMSLTTLDHTMQRGAYEAAYLGKPIITSDFGLLRAAFTKGAVFVANDAEAIAQGVRDIRAQIARYEQEASQLARDKLAHWQTVRAALESLITDAELRARR